jgi:hypothetical protein
MRDDARGERRWSIGLAKSCGNLDSLVVREKDPIQEEDSKV